MSRKIERKTKKKNASTQTNTEVSLEIARLEEEVNVLKLENSVLRKHVTEKPASDLRITQPEATLHSYILTPRRNVVKAPPEALHNDHNLKKNTIKTGIRGCSCKGTCSTKICGCIKKKYKCGETCRCNNSQCQNQDTTLDPMKPKHQLSRTPTSGNTSNLQNVSAISSPMVVVPYPIVKEEKEDNTIAAELLEPEVDWEEYQSRLVPCPKCNRKFHPLRVEKHASCCKNL